MHRNHRLFFLLGLILLFSVFFGYLFYIIKCKPLPPKPPMAAYRIPASDSTSFENIFFYDFENFKQTDLLSSAKSFSGKYALRVKGKNEFSLMIQKPFLELQRKDFSQAKVSAWIQTDSINKLSGKLMFQIVDKANTLKYSYSVNLVEVAHYDNHWFNISGEAAISSYKSEPSDIVKVFYWNNCHGEVFIDDVLIMIGSPTKKGYKPMVDETADNFKFVTQPNQPPYPTIYAQKTLSISFKDTTVLSVDGKTSLEINDNDNFLTGNFIPDMNKTDQILLIHHHLPLAIIWFVPEKKTVSFRIIDQKDFPLDLTIVQWVNADINGDGTDEIIDISGNPQKFKVYSYKLSSRKVELISNDFRLLNNHINQIQKFRRKGKPGESLFVTDITGGSFLLSFEKNKWETHHLGNMSETSQMIYDRQVVSGKFIKANGNDNILLLYRERKSGRCFYKLFDIDPVESKKTCIQQGSFDNKCDTLYPENIYFAGDINRDGISELISYGNSWRFDMKVISFTEKDYRILGNIDFRGYEADHNPKYYEDLMMTAGNFADSKTFSFFTVCKNKKAIHDLPETIGIYSLPFLEKEITK
jgi:hypothetical protein